jgi:hypothetical protein
VSGHPAPLAQLGTHADHLVVELDDRKLGDASFQSASPRFARAGAKRSRSSSAVWNASTTGVASMSAR